MEVKGWLISWVTTPAIRPNVEALWRLRKRRSVKTFSSIVTPIVKATKEIIAMSVCTSNTTLLEELRAI